LQDSVYNLEDDTVEDLVWKTIDPNNMWVLDKLILSKKLGYVCGPTGIDVPSPGWYIVRPCVNAMGLGLGAERVWLDCLTTHLPLGYFWCEWFEGRHLSVDYHYGLPKLCVEGFKQEDTFTRWDRWIQTDDFVHFPQVLDEFISTPWINCEFIGGKLIEVHFRHNMDFEGNIEEFIPVWEGQDTTPPEGYTYKKYPDVHGRIGAFVK
jgi:hypothetical protein